MAEIDIPLYLEDTDTGLDIRALLIVQCDVYGGIEGYHVQDDVGRRVPLDISGAKVRQLVERHAVLFEEIFA